MSNQIRKKQEKQGQIDRQSEGLMENADFYDKPISFRYKGKASYGNCCGTFCTVMTVMLMLVITAFRVQYYLI